MDKKTAKIKKLTTRINRIIVELAELQKERDEESLVRLSDLAQQRDKLMVQLEELEVANLKAKSQENQKKKRSGINIGSYVVLKNGKGNFEVCLVSDYEADPANGEISASSPLGSELMSKEEGAKFKVETPGGMMNYQVLQVK